VVLGAADVEVADRECRVGGLLEIARLEEPFFVYRVRPRTSEAVGLQFVGLRGRGDAGVEDPELVLEVVRVLMGNDVGDGEIACGVSVAG
jgi:hypothetical protein